MLLDETPWDTAHAQASVFWWALQLPVEGSCVPLSGSASPWAGEGMKGHLS